MYQNSILIVHILMARSGRLTSHMEEIGPAIEAMRQQNVIFMEMEIEASSRLFKIASFESLPHLEWPKRRLPRRQKRLPTWWLCHRLPISEQ